jgi:hypothetical protein
MKKKIDVLRAHMQRGEWKEAIRIAARFPRLGDARNVILDAHMAYTSPGFLAQVGRDPDAAKEAGRTALLTAYGV